jgi:hypothetical protein
VEVNRSFPVFQDEKRVHQMLGRILGECCKKVKEVVSMNRSVETIDLPLNSPKMNNEIPENIRIG